MPYSRPLSPAHVPLRRDVASRWARAIAWTLRVPLFWKLLWAGVAVSTGTALFVLWVAGRQPGGLSPTEIVVLLAGLTAGTAVVQAVVLWIALQPLAMLESTAQRVRNGDWSARAGASRVEDVRLRRVRVAFNEMLDDIDAARRRQSRVARDAIVAEEDERDRIARELYGEPAQALAGLLVRLRVLVRSHPEISGAAGDLETGIRNALEEVRRLARRLRPPELHELGVRAALAAHVRSLDGPHGLEPVIEGAVPDHRLAPEVALTMFRVCQAVVTRSMSGAPSSAGALSITFVTRDDRVVVDLRCPSSPAGPGVEEFDAWVERVRWSGGRLTRGGGPGPLQRLRLTLPLVTLPRSSGADAPAQPFLRHDLENAS